MTAFTPEHRKLLDDLSTYASACSVDEAMAIRALLAAHDELASKLVHAEDVAAKAIVEVKRLRVVKP